MALGILFSNPAFAYCPKPAIQVGIPRTPEAAKTWAKAQLPAYGWGNKAEWKALDQLWTNESNWRCDAQNHTPVKLLVNGRWRAFYAGGIPQRLGLSPKSSVKAQIKAGLGYIKARYGSPAIALRWWNKHYWY